MMMNPLSYIDKAFSLIIQPERVSNSLVSNTTPHVGNTEEATTL